MLVGEAKAPVGRRIYAIGDIHGCVSEVEDIFHQIEFDLKFSSFDSYIIITVGDYVDRGPDSRGVIEFLIGAQRRHPLVCLLGNHDQRFLEFLEVPDEVGEVFLHYGGREALHSYGVEVGETPDIANLSRQLKRQIPRSHLNFLRNLQLQHIEGDYAFVHAGIKPEVPMAEQSAKHLLWIREEFLTYQKPHEKVIVHGHTIHDSFDIQPNRINTDTGAFNSGKLTCAVLFGSEIEKLQTTGMR